VSELGHRLRHFFPIRVIEHTFRDDATVMAGGVALFLLLGLLPTMAAVVAVYALIADPASIQGHLAGLDRVLPRAVFDLIVDQLQRAASRSADELGAAVAGSVLLALYSSQSSASALLTGIAHVDGSPPQFKGWRRLGVTIAIACTGLIALVTLMVLVIALPSTAPFLEGAVTEWLFKLRWPVLTVAGVFSLSALYRLGGGHRRLVHIIPGAIIATALGLLASLGVSWYVSELSGYQALYGAFGGAMIVILWFYAVSLAVLVGAVVNVELRAPTP
jgi:membrane protein